MQNKKRMKSKQRISYAFYPALTGSKTPTKKFSLKQRRQVGDQLSVNARLVRADNQWGIPPSD
ncbi:hypothetical protein BTG_15955 [Bacillus thuringiensis HD-771]|uniref:Uncharacterized protein n=1 Tax=Bacillus thuringiensis HD-771 TaxID=1218175 RepID=A0A9W3NY50_BACTU|nr:hypothetical protein BTG_15955 [Bacillus thuringiensis HD-771]